MVDRYKQRRAHAKWTWRECKCCSYHKKPRNKDRESGRAEKRAVRQVDRKEIEHDRDEACYDE